MEQAGPGMDPGHAARPVARAPIQALEDDHAGGLPLTKAAGLCRASDFDTYMRRAAASGRLVVQPRMGFGRLDAMREGLAAVKGAFDAAPRIGTVTIDAYTRVGQVDLATEALRQGQDLNGFPILSHGTASTCEMLEGLRDRSFPVQVRHGSAFPLALFKAAAASGFDAIEGGPVSYNLPYSRARLSDTIPAWAEAARFWADHGARTGRPAHLETFAGCMLGQLCPPSLLIALSILEGLFFVEHGIQSLSLSLVQNTCAEQDVGALMALRELAEHHFPATQWHVVFYTFMGLFPQTVRGAEQIIQDSARIAVLGGAERLIVKTVAEASGIATIAQNVSALRLARFAADATDKVPPDAETLRWSALLTEEAMRIIVATLQKGPTIGAALAAAFADGTLDVPYCLHPDNSNVSRTAIDPETLALLWENPGAIPVERTARGAFDTGLRAKLFHAMLDCNRRRYDDEADPHVAV